MYIYIYIYIYIYRERERERERECVCKIFCSERILKENIDFYKKSARTSILSEYKRLFRDFCIFG